MQSHWYMGLLLSVGLAGIAHAQERVVPAKDPEALFTSSDPKLNANKQVVYHIMKDLLDSGHWELAPKYMTERYIQHNPNLASGRDTVANAMSKEWPKIPIPEKIKTRVVMVVAEGDYVINAIVNEQPHPTKPGETYTTTHFDMWRIQDGKVDEHWDSALLGNMFGGPGGPNGEKPKEKGSDNKSKP